MREAPFKHWAKWVSSFCFHDILTSKSCFVWLQYVQLCFQMRRYQSEYWKRISESQGRQERHMLRTGGEFKVYQVSGRQKHEGPVFATRFLKAFELF